MSLNIPGITSAGFVNIIPFTDQTHAVALLQAFERECGDFEPTQPTVEEDGQDRSTSVLQPIKR